jgi:hypothetical protein
MEKYRLVQEHKADGDEFLEPTISCEVRITQQGKPRNYISYAMGIFVSCLFLILFFVAALPQWLADVLKQQQHAAANHEEVKTRTPPVHQHADR